MSRGTPQPLQRPPGYIEPGTPIKRPMPPRKTTLPPSLKQQKKNTAYCRVCCCCLCGTAIISILFFISSVGFFYLWFEPRLPEFQLKSMDFTVFNITSISGGLSLDAQSNGAIQIKNPNSYLKLQYERTQIFLNPINSDENLGQGTVPPFTQDQNNMTTIKFITYSDNEILRHELAEDLKNKIKNNHLAVDIELRSGIGLKSSGLSTGIIDVRIRCQGVSLSQTPSSSDSLFKPAKNRNTHVFSASLCSLRSSSCQTIINPRPRIYL